MIVPLYRKTAGGGGEFPAPVVAYNQLTVKLKNIFLGPKGIRSGWRFLIFVFLLQLINGFVQKLIYGGLHYKEHALWHPVDFLMIEGITFAVTLLTALVMMQFIERKRWSFRDYGLGTQKALPLFLAGSLWGILLPSLVMLLIYVFNGVSFHGVALSGAIMWHFALLWLAAMLLLGCSEEFLFRGYPLFTLSTGIGFWPASIVLSLIFGGLHYFTKPMETWIDATSVTAIGFFLCLALRRTGNLWFPIGFHAAFDYVALVFYGSPNSGNQGKSVQGAILNTNFHGAGWLTGGPCGIEASILILPLIVLMFVIFNRMYKQAVYPPATS
jgi:membrane protease YdiL (CAAX protease family)